MNILHLAKFFPPDPGGMESVVGALARGAAQRGHRVRVVCATGSRWTGRQGRGSVETAADGLEIARLPTYGVLWSQPITPRYLSFAQSHADVVYVHRPHPLADLAVIAGKRRPTIVFHHADVQRQRSVRALYGRLARAVARRAAATVVATEAHLRNATDLGDEGIRDAHVIPYGTDITRFTPAGPADRPPAFPPASAGPVGLFVGRLVGYKGLDVLLEAVVGTRLSVVIVGDGPLRAQLERRIARLGIGAQVRLTGAVTDEDLPAYYRAADYFMLPSTTPAEMFGVALLEAMACGTPVITTELPTGVREVNEAGVTGLEVPPGDPGALRSAMAELAGNDPLRRTLGEAARRRVEERFTVDLMVDRHLELCERVVGGGA